MSILFEHWQNRRILIEYCLHLEFTFSLVLKLPRIEDMKMRKMPTNYK